MTATQTTKKDFTRTGNVWKATKDTGSHPCIWMQAGVTAKKNCNHYYDCTTCKYDAAMAKAATAGKHITWQNAMRKRDANDRICRHALTGRADMRPCPMNYNCDHCEFDQMFEEAICQATGNAVGTTDVKGFKLADGYYFHSGHTWASIESGGVIRVGMDDFAFKVLGGPDGFDLPLVGQELNMDKTGWGMRVKDNQTDVRSPINGVITRVNLPVNKTPGKTEEAPYQDGWLFTVHNSDIKDAVKPLMADDDSVQWLDGEVTTLEGMIEEITGPMATDGGLLTRNVYGNLPGLGWNRLCRTFL